MDELAEIKTRYERLQLLYQVSNVIHSTLDPDQALQLMLQEAVRIMNASSGSIILLNPKTGILEIETTSGLPAAAENLELRAGEGITGWVAKTGKPARVGDVRKDPRYIMVRRNVRSELAVAMEHRGEVRGVINVDSDRLDAFSADDQELLEALATHAVKVIQNTWLYEQLRLKTRLLETLLSVSQTINSTLNVNDALQVITREACTLMEAKACSLLMLDSTNSLLELRASFGAGEAYIKKPPVSVEDSFLGIVVRRRKPMRIENVQVSGIYQNASIARAEGFVSMLAAPLVFGGKSMGTLNIYFGRPHNFSNEEIHILTALAGLSAIAIEKARLYERIVDAEEQLRQNEKLSALGLLAAEVAHEIRNPLTVMKMLYHSLNLKFAASDPRSKDDEIFRDKMDLLNKIVEQVLDFARSTEPKLTLVSVNQVINDLGLLTRHKLRNQKIEFSTHLDPDLPQIMADSTQLSQAFLNLTLNAVEAMPEGGKLSITSRKVFAPRKSPTPTHVLIEFKDSGNGMSKDQREKAFSSLLSTTKKGGTGLGLAIVGRVVETHRGKVKIRSNASKGTTMCITLPVEQ